VVTLSTLSPDRGGQFAQLFAGWLEARAKLESARAAAPKANGSAQKLRNVADDFARRLAATPAYDLHEVMAKLELLDHYLWDDPPTASCALLGSIRADVVTLQNTVDAMDDNAIHDMTESRARIVTAIATRGAHAVARHG
jgi:hypothetical protein